MTDKSSNLHIVPLESCHDRDSFSCGVEALDRYLRTTARQDAKRGLSAPFVAVEGKSSAILGYYTLSMASSDLDEFPAAVKRKLPRYPRIPAILLGRFAVDSSHGGMGIGKLMLLDAMDRSLRNEIAWFSMIVEAKDESAVRFYIQFGFESCLDKPSRLYLPRQDIEEAFKGRGQNVRKV